MHRVIVLLGLVGCVKGPLAGVQRGTAIGSGIGFVTGIALGQYAKHECETIPENDRDCLAPAIFAPILITATGAVVGAAVGLVAGAINDDDPPAAVTYVPAPGGGTLTTRVRF